VLKRTTGSMNPVSAPAANDYRVTVFATSFQVRGVLRVNGILQTYMNDPDRPTIIVNDAQMTGFEPSNPAARINLPELVIRKVHCGIVAFEDSISAENMKLLPRGEQIALYTDRFIAEGEYHMGADSRIGDFVDISLQQFILAINVRIYPLVAPRTPLVPFAPMIAVHKSAVHLYHAVPSGG